MKIAVTIPIYHSNDKLADFTRQVVESIRSDIHDVSIYLVINHTDPEFHPDRVEYKFGDGVVNFVWAENEVNSVSGAWNIGIGMALDEGNDYVLIANNDIVFHRDAIDNLVDFAEKNKDKYILFTASEHDDLDKMMGLKSEELDDAFDEHPHFSCFMISQKTIDIVGWLDEKMQMAYFEDGDYHYRVLLSGNKAAKTNRSKFFHYGSRTIKTDNLLDQANRSSYENNRVYIKNKWGLDLHSRAFSPPEEALEFGYEHPFNNSNKTLKDW